MLRFSSEPELLEGPGAVKRLPALIKSKNINKVLVVTDKGLTGLHLLDGMYEKLDEAGVDYVVYDGTQPNPTIDNIEEARALYLDNGCPVELPVSPVCGFVYVPEELALGKVASVERALEDK